MASQLNPTYQPSPTLDLVTLQNNLMATINGRWDAFEKRFAEMEKSVQYISDQYDALAKELASQKALCAELKKDLEDVHHHENERDAIISQQNARINQLEQASLSNTIEILGIPPVPISDKKENVYNTLQARDKNRSPKCRRFGRGLLSSAGNRIWCRWPPST